MKPIIIREKLAREALARIVAENFGDMVKVDVDVERGVLVIGGEWHSEGDELLVRDGSNHEHVWGINFYPERAPEERIEYISLINIKPQSDNRSMEVENREVRKQIREIVERLLLAPHETCHV